MPLSSSLLDIFGPTPPPPPPGPPPARPAWMQGNISAPAASRQNVNSHSHQGPAFRPTVGHDVDVRPPSSNALGATSSSSSATTGSSATRPAHHTMAKTPSQSQPPRFPATVSGGYNNYSASYTAAQQPGARLPSTSSSIHQQEGQQQTAVDHPSEHQSSHQYSSLPTLASGTQARPGAHLAPPDAAQPPSNPFAGHLPRPWTQAEDDALLASFQRHGKHWNKTHAEFHRLAGIPGHRSISISALANRLRELNARTGQQSRFISEATRVFAEDANSRANSKKNLASPSSNSASPARGQQQKSKRSLWLSTELDVLRKGIADEKEFREIYAEYQATFPSSKRSMASVRTKHWTLANEVGGRGQELGGEGDGDGGSEHEEGEVAEGEEDRDDSMNVGEETGETSIEDLQHSHQASKQDHNSGRGQETDSPSLTIQNGKLGDSVPSPQRPLAASAPSLAPAAPAGQYNDRHGPSNENGTNGPYALDAPADSTLPTASMSSRPSAVSELAAASTSSGSLTTDLVAKSGQPDGPSRQTDFTSVPLTSTKGTSEVSRATSSGQQADRQSAGSHRSGSACSLLSDHDERADEQRSPGSQAGDEDLQDPTAVPPRLVSANIASSTPRKVNGKTWASWQEGEDDLLLSSMRRNFDDTTGIQWLKVQSDVNRATGKSRTKRAVESRWHFLLGRDSRIQPSAEAAAAAAQLAASLGLASGLGSKGTATPSASASQRKKAIPQQRTTSGWSSEEVQVLRQSLRQHPGIPGSYPAIYEHFYKTFPTSTRTRSAIRLKCETMIGLAARRDEYQSTDEEGESGEGNERGGARRGAKRAGGLVEKVGNVTKRPVNKTPRLYYDDGERSGGGGASASRSALSGGRATRSMRATRSPPRATLSAQVTRSSRATHSPLHDSEAWDHHHHNQSSAHTTPLSHNPNPSSAASISVGITYHPSGILVTGIFPGLEVLVFSPTCVQLREEGGDWYEEEYEYEPAFYLKVLKDMTVQAVVAPPGATMGMRLVPRDEGLVQARGDGTAVQTSCVGADGFEVALRS